MRGRQQLREISTGEISDKQIDNRFTKGVALWIPRQFLSPSGVNLDGFIADVNDKISNRGFVLWDGQLLTTPLKNLDNIKVYLEGNPFFEVPPYRYWGADQQQYFGLTNPYQMIEDVEQYTYSNIMTRIDEHYLLPSERIIALLHGIMDDYYFYCSCHQAEVVYTTMQKIICMGCGAIHAVLKEAIPISPKSQLTQQEWADFFDHDGCRLEEEVDLSILDFREVEEAETIWSTNQWEDSKDDFIFFARSSPEEIEEAIRGTERDPTIFMEAGWRPTETAPPPAFQIADNSIDIDLLENAASALQEGISAYLAARKSSDRLLIAIPQLFKVVELLLKAKLQTLDHVGLVDRPRFMTVLNRLAARDVNISKEENHIINLLRQFRNDLQHSTAKFNYRAGISLCRKVIIFLNRFLDEELGLWIGDALSPEDRFPLLAIPELAKVATTIVDMRLQLAHQQPEATISKCPRCNLKTLVRPFDNTGASCLFCGYIGLIPNSSC